MAEMSVLGGDQIFFKDFAIAFELLQRDTSGFQTLTNRLGILHDAVASGLLERNQDG